MKISRMYSTDMLKLFIIREYVGVRMEMGIVIAVTLDGFSCMRNW